MFQGEFAFHLLSHLGRVGGVGEVIFWVSIVSYSRAIALPLCVGLCLRVLRCSKTHLASPPLCLPNLSHSPISWLTHIFFDLPQTHRALLQLLALDQHSPLLP